MLFQLFHVISLALWHFHSKASADTFQPSVYREVTSKEALLAISICRREEEEEKKNPPARASWDREWSSTFFALAYNRIKRMIREKMKLAKIFVWYLICSLPINSVLDSLDKHLLILSAEIKWSQAGIFLRVYVVYCHSKKTLLKVCS